MSNAVHNIEPVYNSSSRILILGSFPSVKSRETQFFYGHPQNRFWKVLAGTMCHSVPISISEKRNFLLDHHIALWDVIASCDIEGSSDSSIKNVIPNDLSIILNAAPIKQIYCNGAKSHNLYQKHCQMFVDRPAIKLPSTSPANAAYSLDKLMAQWRIITE